MKLRIQNNSVRLRLNEGEVKELNAGKGISSLTQLPGGNLSFVLKKGGANSVRFNQGELIIEVHDQQIKEWADSEEVTIAMEFDTPNEEKLSILVEKDMKI